MTKRKVVSGDQNNNKGAIVNSKKRQKATIGDGTTSKVQQVISKATSNKTARQQPEAVAQNGQQEDREPVWIYGLINNIEQMLSQFNAANNNQRLHQAVQQQQQQLQQEQQQQQQQQQCQQRDLMSARASKASKASAGAKSRSSATSSGYSTPSSLYSSASLSPPFSSSTFNSSSASTSNSPTGSAAAASGSQVACQSPGRANQQSAAASASSSFVQASTTKSNQLQQQQQQQQHIPRSPISRQIKFHEYKGPPQTRRPANQQKHAQPPQAPQPQKAAAAASEIISERMTTATQQAPKSPDCVIIEHKCTVALPPLPTPPPPPPQQQQHLEYQQQHHQLVLQATDALPQAGTSCAQIQRTCDTFSNHGSTTAVSMIEPQVIRCNQATGAFLLRQQQQHQQQQQQQHVQCQQQIQLVNNHGAARLVLSAAAAAELVRYQRHVGGAVRQPAPSCHLIQQQQQQQQAPVCYEQDRCQPPSQQVSLQVIRAPNGGQQQVLVLDPSAFQKIQHQNQQQQHLYNHCDQSKANLIVIQQQQQQQQQQPEVPMLHNHQATVRLQQQQGQQQQQQVNAYDTLINNDNFYSQHALAAPGNSSFMLGNSAQVCQRDQMDFGDDVDYHDQQQPEHIISAHMDEPYDHARYGPIREGTTTTQGQDVVSALAERESMIEDAYQGAQEQRREVRTKSENQYQQQEHQSSLAQQQVQLSYGVAVDSLHNGDNNQDNNNHDELQPFDDADDTCEIEPTISFGGQPFDDSLLFSEFIDLQDIPLNVAESDWLRKFLPPCSSSSSTPSSLSTTR